MIETIGRRLRELRLARGLLPGDLRGVSRRALNALENGRRGVSLGYLERIAGHLGAGLARFFIAQEQFDQLMLLEDRFVLAVIPYLKQLDEEQKKLILQTLEAAPKQEVQKMGRPRSAHIGNPTSSESSRFIASKDLTIHSQI